MNNEDEKNMELINLWAKFWNEKKPEELAKIFVDDLTYEDIATGTISHTANELIAFLKRTYTFSSDIQFVLKDSFIKGNKGCVEWLMIGTQTGPLEGGVPPTNKKFEVKGLSVLSFQDGKIKSCSDYCNMMTILKQIGLINK